MKDGQLPPTPARVMNEEITAHVGKEACGAHGGTRLG